MLNLWIELQKDMGVCVCVRKTVKGTYSWCSLLEIIHTIREYNFDTKYVGSVCSDKIILPYLQVGWWGQRKCFYEWIGRNGYEIAPT